MKETKTALITFFVFIFLTSQVNNLNMKIEITPTQDKVTLIEENKYNFSADFHKVWSSIIEFAETSLYYGIEKSTIESRKKMTFWEKFYFLVHYSILLQLLLLLLLVIVFMIVVHKLFKNSCLDKMTDCYTAAMVDKRFSENEEKLSIGSDGI